MVALFCMNPVERLKIIPATNFDLSHETNQTNKLKIFMITYVSRSSRENLSLTDLIQLIGSTRPKFGAQPNRERKISYGPAATAIP